MSRQGEDVWGDPVVDVVQIGFGPGGQALAALMGKLGHTVLAVERYPQLYNLPRAGHVDHEVVRVVQQVGDAHRLVDKMREVRDDYAWINGDGVQLMLQPLQLGSDVSGWYADYSMYQPDLEDAFVDALADTDVEVLLGWDVVGIRERDDHVELVVNRASWENGAARRTEEYRTIRARYVVAADGASSFTRTTLGIEREDLGFNERWLDVDMLTLDQEFEFSPNIVQICDPARPRMLMPMGQKHRRFEWMVLPDESSEGMEQRETAWGLLAEWGVTPETHEIVRQLVYTFQARIARRWRVGRIFLAGDAAHTMPPYAGQGLCSAVRDANNLAWKLDLVLRGLADDALLESYEDERKPHARAWTEISIAEGEVSCQTDPERARQRDDFMLSGAPLPIPHFPQLSAGLLVTDDHGAPIAPAGSMGIQARVRHGEREGLFDDVLGHSRFQVIAHRADPADVLDDRQRAFLQAIGGIVVGVAPPDEAGPGLVADLDGVYAAYFARHGLAAVVNRPDFYVYGGTAALEDLGSLVERLEADLGSRQRAEAR